MVALIAKNRLPDKTLNRDDFQVFDNGHPVSIKTFDRGAKFTTRPLALWFVDMQGYETKGSGLFQGQISLLKPARKNVDKQDTVAVAHWCDDGQSKLDLLPTRNVEEAATALEQILTPMPDTNDHDRTGELALQKSCNSSLMLRTRWCPNRCRWWSSSMGTTVECPDRRADHFIDELLETSAVAYGLRDHRSPRIWLLGEQGAVTNYIATDTGGQYLRVTPETYATGLGEILEQLHCRYELGFNPEALDGKRHKLRVKRAHVAKNQHKGVRLRYRAAYVPVAFR